VDLGPVHATCALVVPQQVRSRSNSRQEPRDVWRHFIICMLVLLTAAGLTLVVSEHAAAIVEALWP
jgi:hypothetical protein